jgi:hypothetical protein
MCGSCRGAIPWGTHITSLSPLFVRAWRISWVTILHKRRNELSESSCHVSPQAYQRPEEASEFKTFFIGLTIKPPVTNQLVSEEQRAYTFHHLQWRRGSSPRTCLHHSCPVRPKTPVDRRSADDLSNLTTKRRHQSGKVCACSSIDRATHAGSRKVLPFFAKLFFQCLHGRGHYRHISYTIFVTSYKH